ncbi:MAG: hypothetical protein ACREMX_08985 [Gemmatimonadales bacterium]
MRPGICALVLLTAVVSGCESSTGNGELITGNITIAGGGFSDTGVEGFGGLDLPNSWEHLYGRKQEGDPDRECRDQQRCGVGGVVDAFGLLTGENGGFALVTTGDFRCTPSDFFDECDLNVVDVPVAVSGVRSFAILVDTDDGQTWTGATLLLEYALLSARTEPAGAQDSVVVRVLPEAGAPTRVLRLTASDLGGSLPLRSGTCGNQPLPAPDGADTNYPSCSEWTEAALDLTDFIGQSVRIEFVAGEAGAAIALAFDEVRIEVSR